jgi:hypothetical protein
MLRNYAELAKSEKGEHLTMVTLYTGTPLYGLSVLTEDLVDLFGGITKLKGEGYYTHKDGSGAHEDCRVFKVAVPTVHLRSNIPLIELSIRTFLRVSGEKSVLMEFGGSAEFIRL